MCSPLNLSNNRVFQVVNTVGIEKSNNKTGMGHVTSQENSRVQMGKL